MKQNIFKRLALAAALLLSATTASAHDFEVNGIYYNKNEDGTTVSVTYKGNSGSSYDEYSGKVRIPTSVSYSGNTYSVTSIGESAFYYCDGLTAVEIHNSVISIGDGAFASCSGLTEIEIPNSVTSIGSWAFYGCSGLTEIEIPNSVTSIGNYAFSGCSGLTAVEIPNSVASIGYGAFRGCSGLTTIKVQSGNQAYDSRDNCNAIIETATNTLHTGCKSTLISNSVTSIGESAFYYCSGLTAIEIPNSVTSIGSWAFGGCSGLTEVSIGNGVTSIGDSAFWGCDGLTRVDINDIEAWCNITFDYSSNPLLYAHHLYLNGSEVTNLIIPSTITKINDSAFYGCDGLTAIEIPNSVTSIGCGAFEGCSGLTAVSIGNSVTSIGQSAFYGCDGLTRVDITDLEWWCNIFFGGYGANPLKYAHHLYLNGSEITNLILPNTITKINDYAFEGCDGLTAVEIPNSVTSIGEFAFNLCRSLTAIEIPNSVTSIGESAFNLCRSLTAIEIPNSVTSIGYYAFSGCSGLTAVEIPNSVTSIGYSAFYDCDNLEMVFYNARNCTASSLERVFGTNKKITFVIGAEVEQIGDCVLKTEYYNDTKKIVSHATTPPVITSNTFSTTSCPLYVSKDSYAKYWAADVWGDFSDMKQIENPVTKIELNKGAMNIATNSTVKLTATITPDNATLKEVFWSSDAPTVASVDKNGNVTGIQTGKATITAIAIGGSGVKATCLISVGEIIAENLSLNPSEITLAINQSAKITPVTTPESISNTSFEWSTSNTNVAPYRTNSDGSITVLGAADGVATITCRTTDSSNLTATCTVTVGTGAVDGIEADAAKVRGENGVIRIECADGAAVEVFNAAGVCVFSGVASEIPVAQRGIYVVKVAGRATKIAL